MAIPSLAMIPSGYKDGKVYSVLPANGDGDFTFSRGSNATRVNKDGLIETMPLELGSELITNGGFDTDSDWTKGTGWSISGGKANSVNTLGFQLSQPITYTSGKIYKVTYTISNYVSGSIRAYYGGTGVGAERNANGTYTDYIAASGSQTFYIRSATTFTGSIDNVSVKEVLSGYDLPRLDYSDSSCPSLLLEPQRTNLATYSEDFSNAYWTKSRASVTNNSLISPDGTLNASKFTQTTSTAWGGVVLTITPSGASTLSIFAKKIDNDYIALIGHNSNDTKVYFNLDNGTIGTVGVDVTNADIQNYGNGWYRCILTASSINRFTVLHSTTDNGSTANLNTETSLWGAQLEEGSYATSYIPTNGAAATRLADICNSAGTSDTFNDSEGVLMAEIKSENTSVGWIGLGSNSANRILLGGNGTYIRSYNNIGGTVIDYISPIIVSDNNKIAIKYKSGDTDIYINGFKLFESNSAFSVSSPFDEIQFKNLAGETQNFYGNTKQIQYYNSALTGSELEELTSWESFLDMANGQNYTIK